QCNDSFAWLGCLQTVFTGSRRRGQECPEQVPVRGARSALASAVVVRPGAASTIVARRRGMVGRKKCRPSCRLALRPRRPPALNGSRSARRPFNRARTKRVRAHGALAGDGRCLPGMAAVIQFVTKPAGHRVQEVHRGNTTILRPGEPRPRRRSWREHVLDAQCFLQTAAINRPPTALVEHGMLLSLAGFPSVRPLDVRLDRESTRRGARRPARRQGAGRCCCGRQRVLAPWRSRASPARGCPGCALS
ncbi:MAG: hypothetical protein K0Q71_3222, partial [Thermomicrobiales bacterium]|nr:hypothetical protein [Thermomicrobiales bacterium]